LQLLDVIGKSKADVKFELKEYPLGGVRDRDQHQASEK
jgi:hypothetical protein